MAKITIDSETLEGILNKTFDCECNECSVINECLAGENCNEILTNHAMTAIRAAAEVEVTGVQDCYTCALCLTKYDESEPICEECKPRYSNWQPIAKEEGR
jgi:hypothetical protein